MTAFDFFSKAEECEKEAAEIYAHLATVFAADPETSRLFERLAKEELQHAARVRLLGSRHVHDPGLFQSKASSLPDVAGALASARGAREDAVAGKWGMDLAAVMQRAIELEERLARCHAEVIAQLVQPELHRFFSTLLLQDREHRNLLRNAAGRRTR